MTSENMSIDEIIFKIQVYQTKAKKLISHIILLIKSNERYIFSDACYKNWNIFVDTIIKIDFLIKQLIFLQYSFSVAC